MGRTSFLHFSPPAIGEDEIREVVDTLRSDWLSTGPKTKCFEEEFVAAFGCPGAVALNSCTAGLHLALATLGIGPGDEVITTTHTFAATVNVIEHVGARPILVDVEPDTLNIDPAKVEAALSPRTKALIPVHYAGHPVELDSIRQLAKYRGAALIEDAAHAVAAKYKGQWIGSSANPVAFSFYSTKNLATGEGGMLTGDLDFLARARILGLHGMSRDAWKRFDKSGSWRYEIIAPGFKYNMPDISASLGIWQLRRLSELQARRKKIVSIYNQAFSDSPALEIPVERANVEHAWHLYVLRLRTEALTIDRDRFIDELKERNIGSSVHYTPVHMHPYYRDKYSFRPDTFPIALSNYDRMLSIPLSARLSDQDAADVIEAVNDIIRRFRR